MKISFKVFRYVLVILILLLTQLYASNLELTQGEKEFIKKHPIVNLASGESFEPFIIRNNNGTIGGHDKEVLDFITKKTGIKFNITVGKWKIIQKKAIQREYDGITSAGYLKERENIYNYTLPYLNITPFIITKKGNPYHLNNIDDLNGKSIVLQKSNKLFLNIIKNLNLDIKIILVDSIHDTLHTVSSNDAHFTILDDSIFYLADQIGLHGLLDIAFTIGQSHELHFCIRNDWHELTSIMNKALEQFNEKEKLQLRNKWFSNHSHDNTFTQNTLDLKAEDIEYLQKKNFINICVDPQWMPYSAIVNGKYTGMGSDIYKEIEKKLPVKFELIPTSSWTQTLEYAKNGQCDIIDFAIETPNREKYLNFTHPIIDVPVVLITTVEVPYIDDISVLENKTIAVASDYAFIEILKEKYPNLKILEVDTISDGLKLVRDKKVHGYIGVLAPVNYILNEEYIGQLKVTSKLNDRYTMGAAVIKSDERLLSIMNSVIESIDKETIRSIKDKWMNIHFEKPFNYELFYQILAVMSILILFFTYRNFILNRKVKSILEKSRIQDNLIFQQNKMASIGEMMGNIAHQWRQPLSELSMSHNLLLRKIDQDKQISNQELEATLHQDQATIQFMSETITTFQSFYNKDLREKETYIYELFTNVKNILSDNLKINSIKVREDIDRNIEYKCSENYFLQVFLAIFQNSIYFLKTRNILNKEIHIKVYKKSNTIFIEIEDNARGVDEKFINQVFNYSFSKRDNEQTSTGLGLYISKLLINEKLQGSIDAVNGTNGLKILIKLKQP